MGDATGDTSGGIKRAVMVNPRGSNPACLGTPRVDFIFRVDGRLTQCGDFIFTGYTNATKPVTVRAYIPGGESEVTEPKTDDSFNWNMALRAGTPVLFYMTDSDGRNGGVSDLMTVGSSTDDSCLKPASGAGNKDSEDGEGLSVGVIAGAAVGAVVMLIMGILVGVFVIRRRRTKTVQFVQPLMNETGMGYTSPTQGFFHGTSHAYAPVPSTTGSMHDRQQSLSYSNSQYSAGGPSSAPFYRKSYGPQAELVQSDAGASSSSSAPGPSQPRVVVHQDISEAQEAVVELPPQYSESLAPIPGLSGEGSSSTSTPIRQGKS
ncbi:hypothetical protein CC2G_002572 [Coprinopsis cinerea AmutBmut pab1-1]|nr:hypothetical protein CC2G_002572 [Coprinopsis cinerea AmutBmut pab1-1]